MLTISMCLDILNLESDCTMEEIKKRYRELAKTWHPDLGGCQEKMQLLNQAYELLIEKFEEVKNFHRQAGCISWFDEMLVVLLKLEDIVIEVCGSWIWVSGNTYNHKARIKEIGFKWSGSKKKWYAYPDFLPQKPRSKYRTSFDQIVDKYGKSTYYSQASLVIEGGSI